MRVGFLKFKQVTTGTKYRVHAKTSVFNLSFCLQSMRVNRKQSGREPSSRKQRFFTAAPCHVKNLKADLRGDTRGIFVPREAFFSFAARGVEKRAARNSLPILNIIP